MTIECYDNSCPKHSHHTDPEYGPFCDEAICIKHFTPEGFKMAMADLLELTVHWGESQGGCIDVVTNGDWPYGSFNMDDFSQLALIAYKYKVISLYGMYAGTFEEYVGLVKTSLWNIYLVEKYEY